MKPLYLSLWLMTLVATGLPAAPANPTRNAVHIADRFPYELSVVIPRDAQALFPTAAATFKPFEIKAFSLKQQAGAQINGKPAVKWLATYQLSAYDLGTFLIPTLTVLVRETDQAGQVVFPAVSVQVVPIPKTARDKDDIRDVKAPFSLPYTWRDILLYGGFLGVLVAALWWLWRKFRPKPGNVIEPLAPLLSPFDQASRQLDVVDTSTLLEQEKFKQYYSQISDIIRVYLFAQFGIDALEMTTSELLDAIKKLKFSWEEIVGVQEWLLASDLVKFAKYIPDAAAARSHLQGARQLLDMFNRFHNARQAAAMSRDKDAV